MLIPLRLLSPKACKWGSFAQAHTPTSQASTLPPPCLPPCPPLPCDVVDEVVKDETDDITDDDDVIAGVTVNERGLYQGSGKRLVLHEALVRKERHVCVHGFVSPQAGRRVIPHV